MCLLFRSLGTNLFSCDCSISLLWKDYKGLIKVFQNRNIIGFHQDKVPQNFKYAKLLPEFLPNLICIGDGLPKTWNQIDLTSCKDDYISTTTTTIPPSPLPPLDGDDNSDRDESTSPDETANKNKGDTNTTLPPFKHQGTCLFLK